MRSRNWMITYGRLVSLFLVLSFLLTGCQVEGHITPLPDGRWRQEAFFTLTDEEVQTWEQETVDQYFSWLEELAKTSGESWQWQKEPIPGGVRYRIVTETAALPNEVLFPYGEWYVSSQITLDGPVG